MPLGLIVDSTANLTAADRAELSATMGGLLRIVDLSVRVGDEERPDSAWSTQAICNAMLADMSVSTSMPTLADFTAAADELVAAGADALLAITLSSGLSGAYGAAKAALEAVSARTGVPAHAVDSATTSAALAGALRVAVAGRHSAPDVLAREVADWCAHETSAFFVPADLDYLAAGGRIGQAAQLAGRALSIVPVLTVREGAVVPLARVRTRSRALERLAALVTATAAELEHVRPDTGVEVVLVHAEQTAEAAGAGLRALRELVEHSDLPDGTRVSTAVLSTVITAHVGPGTLGAVVQTLP